MNNLRILVVDDEEDIRTILEDRLRMYGYEVITASDGLEALEKVEAELPELVLLDILLPGMNGMEVLSRIRSEHPEILVIMITAAIDDDEWVVEAMQEQRAYDFIRKPFNPDLIRIKVDRALKWQALAKENESLRSELRGEYGKLIGKSQKWMDVLRKIEKVAPSDLNVLITGESGTGKELVARSLHDNSPRAAKWLGVVNCAAFQPTLVESELFGHEKGAFTGATERKLGKMEIADGGTLFLDEIGNMAYELQAKLLRAVQEKEFESVGGTHPIKVDIRFISAANHDLQKAIQEGTFREDLFYRLCGVEIALPPLRERRGDIPLLVQYFLQNAALNKRDVQISDEAMEILADYHWPGNVRELQQCIGSTIVLADSNVIRPEHLPPKVKSSESAEAIQEGVLIKPGTNIKEAEKTLILKTLEETGGNKTQAAKLLGISLRNLQYKLKEYESQDEDRDHE